MSATKDIKTAFAISTLNSLGWSAAIPFFAVYLELHRGVALSSIGLVYLGVGFLVFLSQLSGGRLTDSFGPRKVLLFTYALSIMSSLILGGLIAFGSTTSVILALFLAYSFIRNLSQPAVSVLVANQSRSNFRTGISALVIGGNLGFAIGPALGGLLTDAFSYPVVFYLSAAVSAITACVAYFSVQEFIPESSMITDTPKQVRRRLSWREEKNVIVFLILMMLSFIAIGYETTPMSLYTAGFLKFSNAQIGYLFATKGLEIVLLQLPITKFLFERTKLLLAPIVLASGLEVVSFLIAGFSRTFLEMELVMVIITLGEIFLSAPAQTVVTLFSKSGNRGTYQGYFSAFSNAGMSLASFVGPLSFQIFIDRPSLGWFAIAAVCAAVGVGFIALSPRLQGDFEQLAHATERKMDDSKL